MNATHRAKGLEDYFLYFRTKVSGYNQLFRSPFGKKKLVYADWTASGRAYRPIETYLQKKILPFIGNTHTESTITGSLMSSAYAEAKEIIRRHVNASVDDVLIFCGSGMTAAVNKLQRILGLRIPERFNEYLGNELQGCAEALRPIVFITGMEHHSNHLSWLETIADVQIIPCTKDGNVDLDGFRELLERFRHRINKIAAITACSNVTGIHTPYHEIARMIHAYEGLCFVDFACSAPYVLMNMHPGEDDARLDAIFFSPHKFLGGPGTPGILIFNKKLYNNKIPDQPGGGTVSYSNPWEGRDYISDIEQREDSGTPPFLQGIKAGMIIRLKEDMGIKNLLEREKELVSLILERFSTIKNIQVLAADNRNRLGVISFIVEGAHYGLIVKLLNDRFGIQTRGGCSCAGTYGHILLGIGRERSERIRQSIRSQYLADKPGWIRLSIHPVMANKEIQFILNAIEQTARFFGVWAADYQYHAQTNEWAWKGFSGKQNACASTWFLASSWDTAKRGLH